MVSFTVIILIAVAVGFVAVGGVSKSQEIIELAKGKANEFKAKRSSG